MKNNQLEASQGRKANPMTKDEVEEFKRERNRAKRYRQGRMGLRTLLGKSASKGDQLK